MDILIQAARVGADAAALRRAAEGVADWDTVRDQAARHGLGPLLYWRLKECCLHAVPSAISAELQRAFLGNAARNMMMAAELKAVIGWLEAKEVPAIAYKGPTLAAWAYGDIALREFCDLDILVRPSDKTRAVAVLIANGCVPKGAPGAADLSGNCEIGLATRAGCDVDLHWEISASYFPAFNADSARARVHRVEVGGAQIPTFGPDDLFACLALHGARHCWVSLGWICDVAKLVSVAPLNWDGLLANRRTRRMFQVALLLAADLLSAPIPPEIVFKARHDRAAVGLAQQISGNLFTADADLAGRPTGALMQLRMAGTLRDRARYVWRRALQANQTDNDFLPLPPRLKPLLHVIRPFRVMGKIISRGSRLRP
jgi:hypothetical protein